MKIIDEDFSTPMSLEAALEAPERRIIEAALRRNNWNRQSTAAELDINRTTLYKKMRKCRLDVGETNAA
jgi:DNA-binding NtrC family response regulator